MHKELAGKVIELEANTLNTTAPLKMSLKPLDSSWNRDAEELAGPGDEPLNLRICGKLLDLE
jgi:hypothetical protein